MNVNFSEDLQFLADKIVKGSIEMATNIVIAIVIYFLGKIAIRLILKALDRILEKRNIDSTVQKFTNNIVNISLKIALFIAIITTLGVKTSAIFALIASTGFGIGLALNGTLQNFANGIIILIFRPYKDGDFIEVNGQMGTVRDIQIFYTIIITPDNKVVYIPNGTMGTATMINYNQEKIRRIDWVVGIDYGEDFDNVKQVLMSEIVDKEDKFLKDPAPQVELRELADSSVNVMLRCWVHAEDYWDLHWAVNQQIYKSFAKHNINIPFPQLTIRNN